MEFKTEEELETQSALKGHFKPSEKTIKFMEKTTEEITNIKVDMKGVKKDIGYIKDSLGKLEGKWDDFFDKCREIFPDKEEINKFEVDTKSRFEKLEKFISKVMWTAVISFLGFLVNIIWFLIDNFVLK